MGDLINIKICEEQCIIEIAYSVHKYRLFDLTFMNLKDCNPLIYNFGHPVYIFF